MKKITAAAIVIMVAMVSLAAFGASGGHGDDTHIPLDKIGWQAANLGILLVIIFFAVKKTIVEAFNNRQKNYLEQSEKTKSALKDAELALAGIKEKLTNLEAGEKKSIENAHREADTIKAQIISDAVSAAEKLKKDAELTINNELSKAKATINQAILNQALAAATKNLSEKNQSGPTQEASFIKQIEQVKT